MVQPLKVLNLPKQLEGATYYTTKKQFQEMKFMLLQKRVNLKVRSSLKEKLYLK